ncbi:hypothetical protein RJ641_000648 [Dillenia turbinata]|uniref:GIR1-like zinc ribbon domain-containing protein n=1 Tax=Dillenia turbinata TaxID=194707 RepID=A0AAN8ZVY2_9MAGN
MATEVSSLVRVLYGRGEEQKHGGVGVDEQSKGLITRDLLGCCSSSSDGVNSKELDLDLQVPNGFEKRLDLKSGKVYIQRCNSPVQSSSSSGRKELQDLNFPSSKQTLNLFEETSLDLSLIPSSSSSSSHYQSICTLDKVKSALERAEKESAKKRSFSKSSPSSHSSSSIKETLEKEEEEEKSTMSPGLLFAAGCPKCLLYVLISRNNPKCPRCESVISSPMATKRPRIDLNISM